MTEDFILEVAIFTFIMVLIGIGLTVYEFKQHVMKRYGKRRKKN
jgi:hypothetical protein